MPEIRWAGRCLRAVACIALLWPGGYLAAVAEKPSRTVLGSDPWKPASDGPKVIYGSDDRIDLYEETDGDRLTWAASTCALMTRSDLTNNGNGTYTIRTASYSVCPDEPFATQPTAAFCTGFIVGDDLIATAGHCYDESDLVGARFVFGFVMEDASSPVVTVGEENVYHGVEVVTQALGGNLDYAVVRVDRPIAVPGARPFEVRREGTIAAGTPVGVIGHPAGLPLKIAFGGQTRVRASNNPGYFVANLDTYGGNSGSPVIDPATGIVEGILVRGETDFVFEGGCRRSNVLSNSGGDGEDVSKTTTFSEHIPPLASGDGVLSFNRGAYGCNTLGVINLVDTDIAGAGNALVNFETASGDAEVYFLSELVRLGEFAVELSIQEGEPEPGDGVLQVVEGDVVTASYNDALHSAGAPDVVRTTAVIDCTGPAVSEFGTVFVDTRLAVVSFVTDEPASGAVYVGTECGRILWMAEFAEGVRHSVGLTDLEANTTYYAHLEAADEAGNRITADNGGTCFPVQTAAFSRSYTEVFGITNPVDLANTAIRFTPDGALGYEVCREAIAELPVEAAGITVVSLSDDDTIPVVLRDGATFPYLGVEYNVIHFNSNGNISLETGDTDYAQSLGEHFAIPRISAFFGDLNPEAGGQLWYRQLGDRIALTWQNIPRFNSPAPNTVQVELFFSGAIRFSYRTIDPGNTIVGISHGLGLLEDFAPADLSAVAPCEPVMERIHAADTNRDYEIGLQELLRLVQFYNLSGYACADATEDGYQPGAGDSGNCTAHDIDYNPQDWAVSSSELMRGIQLYNASGYAYDPEAGTEDGFVPLMAR